MIAGRYQSKNIFPLMLSGMLLLMAALWLGPASVAALAEEGSADAAASKTVPCKGLKPYNNIDELLYQFYINMESDCLFEKSVAELEEIWEIRILDEERAKPKNFYHLSETEFFKKRHITDKDAFYVVRTQAENKNSDGVVISYRNEFSLKPTKEYLEKHGPLFSDEKLPKLLPAAEEKNHKLGRYHRQSSDHTQAIGIDNEGEVYISRTYKAPAITPGLQKPGQSKSENADATVDFQELPCRGLKRYENLEELLYQFYINLDSDCLFEMPKAELEKIWDTKILNRQDFSSGEYWTTKMGADFEGKPYVSERDAFYIEYAPPESHYNALFTVNITQEYRDKYHSLLPTMKITMLIPEPVVTVKTTFFNADSDKPRVVEGQPGYSMYAYYWYSSDKKRYIYFTWSFGLTEIRINQESALKTL
ncbi:hypothetical protein LJB99_05180 [Deltaproteobacteria bacterium OttesenSCG-928-K17]|nr:hypothetical protein [Deltaproteobacteria bacterium OttesenSCG-928-K17]